MIIDNEIYKKIDDKAIETGDISHVFLCGEGGRYWQRGDSGTVQQGGTIQRDGVVQRWWMLDYIWQIIIEEVVADSGFSLMIRIGHTMFCTEIQKKTR